jgi:multidrug efflux pump subunit AcrA (membrane-fusion protein)
MPPPQVAVATVTSGDLPILLEYTGRAVGSRDVEVRARVSGILLERKYEEGSAVRKGDVLFLIDPEQYRAATAQAQAELGVADARLNEAGYLRLMTTEPLVRHLGNIVPPEERAGRGLAPLQEATRGGRTNGLLDWPPVRKFLLGVHNRIFRWYFHS